MAEKIPEELRGKFLEGFRAATTSTLDEEAMLYAAGGHSARQAMQQGLDAPKMLQGMEDQLSEKPAAYSQEEIAAAFQAFQALQQQAQSGAGNDNNAQAAQDNLEMGQAFLKSNADKEAVTTTDSGLQFEILESGVGDKPNATDEVTVHYTGRLLDGTVFDSSVQRGEPVNFPLDRVISGWTEGLQLMSPGAKYRFWIPANLAYGQNAPPAIGPNQVLDFEVELIKVGS
ncbi:MAG: FKBP-type peptidyl-prolyl cis-trans isomerase [Verrucomicrobia bacterium]|nr:FKBP-type peptidyl-prolyl cis-trans isomerase [Verrucomicrobiota bacterium]